MRTQWSRTKKIDKRMLRKKNDFAQTGKRSYVTQNETINRNVYAQLKLGRLR